MEWRTLHWSFAPKPLTVWGLGKRRVLMGSKGRFPLVGERSEGNALKPPRRAQSLRSKVYCVILYLKLLVAIAPFLSEANQ